MTLATQPAPVIPAQAPPLVGMEQPVDRPRTDMDGLHPLMREAARRLLEKCKAEGFPFDAFETYRSPQRQEWLYAQGRSRSGGIITYAKAWESYHQYGLGVDFVLRPAGKWSWDTKGANGRMWRRMQEIGTSLGLEPLKFELPHLQIAKLKIADLKAGRFPAGGDDAWTSNFQVAIRSWSGVQTGPSFAA